MLGVRVPPGLPLHFDKRGTVQVTKKKVRKLKTAHQAVAQPKPIKASAEGTSGISDKKELVTTPVSRIQAIKQYLREVRAEFDKITWANRKETVSMTIAVVAISMFFSAYLGLVDMSLSKLVGIVIK